MENKKISVNPVAIKETKNEARVKDFIRRIRDCAGEYYAHCVLISDDNVKTSLSMFTSSLDDVSTEEITSTLLKAGILNEDKKAYSSYIIDQFLKEKDVQGLFDFASSNMFFRNELSRLLINQADVANSVLYSKRKSRYGVLKSMMAVNKHVKENIKEKEKTLTK